MYKRSSVFVFVFFGSFFVYCAQEVGGPMVDNLLDAGTAIVDHSVGGAKDHGGFAGDAAAQSGGGACGCLPARTVIVDGAPDWAETQETAGPYADDHYVTCTLTLPIEGYTKVVVQSSRDLTVTQAHGQAGFRTPGVAGQHVVADPTNGVTMKLFFATSPSNATTCAAQKALVTVVGYK